MKDLIYLDNNATTRIMDDVWNTMVPYFIHNYANASSLYHSMGREANAAIEKARTQVAQALNCQTKEIFFNSGATESINTVIKGIFKNYKSKGKHIITVRTEHKAVLTTIQDLERQGAVVTYLEVDHSGKIDLTLLEDHITPETILVCIMPQTMKQAISTRLKRLRPSATEKTAFIFVMQPNTSAKFHSILPKPLSIYCV